MPYISQNRKMAATQQPHSSIIAEIKQNTPVNDGNIMLRFEIKVHVTFCRRSYPIQIVNKS